MVSIKKDFWKYCNYKYDYEKVDKYCGGITWELDDNKRLYQSSITEFIKDNGVFKVGFIYKYRDKNVLKYNQMYMIKSRWPVKDNPKFYQHYVFTKESDLIRTIKKLNDSYADPCELYFYTINEDITWVGWCNNRFTFDNNNKVLRICRKYKN